MTYHIRGDQGFAILLHTLEGKKTVEWSQHACDASHWFLEEDARRVRDEFGPDAVVNNWHTMA